MIEAPVKTEVDPKEYRIPMMVTEWRKGHISFHGVPKDTYYAVCPRCKTSMDRDYARFCSNCGQRLSWRTPR